MDDAIDVASATLAELFHQGERIKTMTTNTENIDDNLSIAERIMKSMKSLLYRFTYSREISPTINHCDDRGDEDHRDDDDHRVLGKLKQINIAIGTELSRQNTELNNIDEKIIDANVKLERLNKSF
jgi:hypothetical protein